MRIQSIHARRWVLPLLAPFAVAKRTAYDAQNVLIIVMCDGAEAGYGASVPVSYVTGEDIDTVIAAIAGVAPLFEGMPVERIGPLLHIAGLHLADAPSARAGLEMALYDVWGKKWNLPLWQFFGGMTRQLVTDLTIPITLPEDAARLAEEAMREGFRHLKIKVGDPGGHEADFARVEAVFRAAPEITLRLDANQAFTPDNAITFVRRILNLGVTLDLVEQPVDREDIAGHKFVRQHLDVPVYADESACTPQQVLNLIREEAVDGINIKLMKSGISGALEIISLCRSAGLGMMLGCMLETRLGIAAAAQIAAGTGAFHHCDLDSHRLLAPIGELRGGFRTDGDLLVMDAAEDKLGGWGVTLDDADLIG